MFQVIMGHCGHPDQFSCIDCLQDSPLLTTWLKSCWEENCKIMMAQMIAPQNADQNLRSPFYLRSQKRFTLPYAPLYPLLASELPTPMGGTAPAARASPQAVHAPEATPFMKLLDIPLIIATPVPPVLTHYTPTGKCQEDPTDKPPL